MGDDAAAQRAALWDAWELVEGRSAEEIKRIYRSALESHGLPVREGAVTVHGLVLAGGASWTGDEVRDGARMLQQRVTTDYRALRERQAATRPIREEIRNEVAAGAAGKTREQVRAELSAAYSAHGLEQPTASALGAEALKVIRPTWKDGLLALRDRRAFVESEMGLSYPPKQAQQDPQPAQPAWSQPPADAMLARRGRQVAVRVELTDDGVDALARLVAEWEPDAPDHQPVCWLTVGDEAADRVTVHLGDREVGRLDAHASDLVRRHAAAAQAAHQPLADIALLTGVGSIHDPFVLRVRLPVPRTAPTQTGAGTVLRVLPGWGDDPNDQL